MGTISPINDRIYLYNTAGTDLGEAAPYSITKSVMGAQSGITLIDVPAADTGLQTANNGILQIGTNVQLNLGTGALTVHTA